MSCIVRSAWYFEMAPEHHIDFENKHVYKSRPWHMKTFCCWEFEALWITVGLLIEPDLKLCMKAALIYSSYLLQIYIVHEAWHVLQIFCQRFPPQIAAYTVRRQPCMCAYKNKKQVLIYCVKNQQYLPYSRQISTTVTPFYLPNDIFTISLLGWNHVCKNSSYSALTISLQI